MSTPKIVTFYSYKGGTGRSMALANVAWILASNAKRVLVIDWDLEAPGLHRYFHPFLGDKELVRSDGLIDFVIQYAELAVAKTKRAKNWYEPYADILRYATSLNFEFPKKGTIDFVPAGRQGADYATRVNAFNWQHFYERLSGGLFLEAVKLSMADYDYVLIDSRTGVSDTSGICTIQMPNVLVVCFTLNTQSIEGAAAVAQSADAQRRTANGKRTMRIMPVPTRVELTERAKLNAGMEAARKKFDPLLWHLDGPIDDYWARVSVQYQPFYAYEEVLAVFGDAPGNPQSMLASMEALASWITGAKQGLRLPASTPAERDKMLARYLRQQREESPYAIRRQTGHTGPVRALAISPDGQHVVSADDRDNGTLLSNLETGEVVQTLAGPAGNVRAVAFSNDGGHVFIGADNAATGLVSVRLSDGVAIGRKGVVYALAATAEGNHVVCGSGNSLLLVSLDPFGTATTLGTHNGPIWAVAVTSDSRFAISGSFDRILIRWSLEKATPLMTYSGHTGEVSSVAVSADNRLILSGSYDNTLKLWDLETGMVLRTFEGHAGRVQTVALSPDGKIAISGSADKMVNVWDVETGRVALPLAGHLAAVNAVAIMKDGRRAISASDDGTLIVWNIEQAIAEKPAPVVVQQPRPRKQTAKRGTSEGPLVYVSFSRGDRDRYFVQFLSDLEESLRLRTGIATQEETIFWWDDSLHAGEQWPDRVTHARSTARVVLCMTSPSYFESEYCGKEFSSFLMREERSKGGIYPIIWRPAEDWPDAISKFQRGGANIGAYEQEGLAYMLRLARHRLGYRQLVEQFAEDLSQIASERPLAHVGELPPLETLPNAFGSWDTHTLMGTMGRFARRIAQWRVVFVFAAESPFGTPLYAVAREVSVELEVYSSESEWTLDAAIVEETAGTNNIVAIVFDRSHAGWFDDAMASRRRSDLSHCAVLMINAPGGPMLAPRLLRNVGYYSGNIQTEAAFRDALRTAIVKIQHAMIAKASLAGGGGGGEPPSEMPNLPTTS